MYEVVWREIDRRFEVVIRRKAFRSAAARDRFCERVAEKGSFFCFLGFRGPDARTEIRFE